jgi:hypothetical protein
MNRWLFLGALGLLAASAVDCAAGEDPDFSSSSGDTTPTTSTGGGGSGGATTSTSGMGGNTGPCDTDCSLINTPQCQVAQCNVQSGQCEVVNDEVGVACDDGLFCTISDSCSAGTCVGGPQNDCGMAPPQCTEVTCDESSQTCSSTPSMNGAPCQDPNDLCLQGSSCSNGLCIGGTQNDCFFFPVPSDCHVATCSTTNGMCEAVVGNEGLACNDPNDLCTVDKLCATGVCQGGTAKDCSNLTMGCDLGVCDTMSGQCVTQAVMNGQGCDDLDFCTSGEICTNGSCGGGTVETQCMTGDQCCPQGCTVNNDLDCIIPVARPAIHRGWWNATGSHSASNNNTYTGLSGSSEYNSYFIFDLSGISGTTVISAELHLEVENYYGNDPSETVSVWDVSTDWNTLENGTSNVGVFNDLMQGATYGNTVVLSSEVTTIKVITLNSQAMTDIVSALGGNFSVGVTLDTIVGTAQQSVRWSASNEARTHELHFQVY